MEKLPRITCLCVSQNRPEFLKQAIYYFRNQTYLNKDLLIVYGGDNKIWEEISLHDENIKVINIGQTTALGAGLLRNIALENCEGDYFCLWDDDDWYHSQRLELQLKSLWHQVGLVVQGQLDLGRRQLPSLTLFRQLNSSRDVFFSQFAHGHFSGR